MKKIVFKWSGATFTGTIISRRASQYLGLVTNVKTEEGMEFTFYGKCEVGPCGPFTVISIN